jgi:ABC-2 type transport system permease protein
MSARNAWWTVAVWEMRRTLSRADFIVSVLVTPLLIVGVLAGTQWMKNRTDRTVHRIAVAADAPRPDSIATVHWIEVRGAEAERGALTRAVRDNTYDGALLLPPEFPEGKPQLILRREIPRLSRLIDTHLDTLSRTMRGAEIGLDPGDLARLEAGVDVEVEVAEPQARSSRLDRIVARVIMLLLMTVIFIAGSYAIIGISGEKQARVTEVIVSAISPQAWMDGKIFAFSVVGLVNGLVWALSGIWVLMWLVPTMPGSLNPMTAAICTVYGLLGLGLYVALFAAIMATLKDFQSASKLQGNFFVIPALPVFFLEPVLSAPEAGFAIATSLIPFFSPMLMPMRVAMGQATTWQIVVGLMLLAASVWLMRKAAGTAMRVGMLMYGKDLSLPELVKLAKQD